MRLLFLLLLLCGPCGAASWYLDNAASGSNNGTSWANAWAGPSNVVWSGMSAGDTLYISGGTTSKVYTAAGAYFDLDTYKLLYCTKAGTAGNPITITVGTDSGHTGRVIFDYGNLGNRAYVINLTDYNVLDGGPHTNIWVINATNQVNRDHTVGIYVGGGSHQVVTRVGVSNVNNGLAGNGGTDCWVKSNAFLYIMGDCGISLNGSGVGWDQNIIERNYVECIRDVGGLSGADGIKCSRGLTARYNTLTNGVGSGFVNHGQHSDAFQTAGFINWTKIYNNDIHAFYNSCFEFGVETFTSNVVVHGNVTHYDNTDLAGASHNVMEWSSEGWLIQSIRDVYFFNNTFVDHSGPNVWMGMGWDKNRSLAGLGTNFPTVTNLVIANTIFYNISAIGYPTVMIGDYVNPNWSASNATSLRFFNNLFYAGSTNVLLGTNDTALGDGVPLLNRSNEVWSDPQFTTYTLNSSANNYRLQSSSPARNAGTNLTALLAAFAGTNIDLVDMDGTAWPASGPWTIGAFEYAAAVTPPPATNTTRIFGPAQIFGSARLNNP